MAEVSCSKDGAEESSKTDFASSVSLLPKEKDMEFNCDYAFNYRFETVKTYEIYNKPYSDKVVELIENLQKLDTLKDYRKLLSVGKEIKDLWKTMLSDDLFPEKYKLENKAVFECVLSDDQMSPLLTVQQFHISSMKYGAYLCGMLNLSVTFIALSELAFSSHRIFFTVAYAKLAAKVCLKLKNTPLNDISSKVLILAMQKIGLAFYVSSLYEQKITKEESVFDSPPKFPDAYNRTLEVFETVVEELNYKDSDTYTVLTVAESEEELIVHADDLWNSELEDWIKTRDNWTGPISLRNLAAMGRNPLYFWETNYTLIMSWRNEVKKCFTDEMDSGVLLIYRDSSLYFKTLLSRIDEVVAVCDKTSVEDKKIKPKALWYTGKLLFNYHVQINEDSDETFKMALDNLKEAWRFEKERLPNIVYHQIRKDYVMVYLFNLIDSIYFLKYEDQSKKKAKAENIRNQMKLLEKRNTLRRSKLEPMITLAISILKLEIYEILGVKDDKKLKGLWDAVGECKATWETMSLAASIFAARATMIINRINGKLPENEDEDNFAYTKDDYDSFMGSEYRKSVTIDLERSMHSIRLAAVTVMSVQIHETPTFQFCSDKQVDFKSILTNFNDEFEIDGSCSYKGIYEGTHELEHIEEISDKIFPETDFREKLAELHLQEEKFFETNEQALAEFEARMKQDILSAKKIVPRDPSRSLNIERCQKCEDKNRAPRLNTFVCNDYEYLWFTKEFKFSMLKLRSDPFYTMSTFYTITRKLIGVMQRLCGLHKAKGDPKGNNDSMNKLISSFATTIDKTGHNSSEIDSKNTLFIDEIEMIYNNRISVKKQAELLFKVFDRMHLGTDYLKTFVCRTQPTPGEPSVNPGENVDKIPGNPGENVSIGCVVDQDSATDTHDEHVPSTSST